MAHVCSRCSRDMQYGHPPDPLCDECFGTGYAVPVLIKIGTPEWFAQVEDEHNPHAIGSEAWYAYMSHIAEIRELTADELLQMQAVEYPDGIEPMRTVEINETEGYDFSDDDEIYSDDELYGPRDPGQSDDDYYGTAPL